MKNRTFQNCAQNGVFEACLDCQITGVHPNCQIHVIHLVHHMLHYTTLHYTKLQFCRNRPTVELAELHHYSVNINPERS